MQMNRMKRNFFMDISLVTLLVVNLITLGGGESGSSPGAELRSHLHAISGIGLMLVSLVHIILHIPWFRAVMGGKVKGRIKLLMYGMVSTFILLAFLSGPAADASATAGRFHEFTGSLALVGMAVHSVKHARWMGSAGKKIITGGQDKVSTTVRNAGGV
jgi:hypothetical protein